MNIYPNTACGTFCTWILANSNIRVTPQRKIQIQNVQTAANSGSYVTLLYYESFVAYTYRFYGSYLQFQALQPNAPSPTTQDALTTAWLAVVSNPAQQTIYAVDAFFKQLRADGNLLFDYCFLFAQDQQANAKIDLMNPTLYSITEHNTPTWTANQGYTGNGTNMYLSANYIESVNANNWTNNSSIYGAYGRVAGGAADKWIMGTSGTVISSAMVVRYTDNNMYGHNDDTTAVSKPNTNTQGLFLSQRTASNVQQIWANGVSLGTGSTASGALINKNDYFLAYNNNGAPAGYDTNQIALALKGSGAVNPITLNSAVNLLMTNLGAHY